jgi:hypothetical protein
MFGNNPWQADVGSDRRRRLFGMPTLFVAALALAWFLLHGQLLIGLAEWFLTPDGPTALELPDDLLLARLPWSHTWNVDAEGDGVLLARAGDGEPEWQIGGIEHWTRPWKEGKRAPIPEAWRIATQAEWRNQPAMVSYFGLGSSVTRDRSLMAVMYHPSQRQGQTRIIALPAGEELARLEAIPAAASAKCIAWHPTDNVLLIGSYGTITLAAPPDWNTRTLATARRDRIEWETRVQLGEEESGYCSNENVSQLLFSEDGAFLIAAMDRGLRVYDWPAVRQAADALPAPCHAVDGTLVPQPLASFKMTFAVAYDARRGLVLWSENDGKLNFLNLATGKHGNLLTLTNRYCLTRLHLCTAGEALIAQIVRMGRSHTGPCALVVLDYPKLLKNGGVEAAP